MEQRLTQIPRPESRIETLLSGCDMTSGRAKMIGRVCGQAAVGWAAVAVTTAACFRLHLDVAVPCCLFLLIVVVQSTVASFASCALVSLIAILCLDYFFVPPLFTLNIDRPADALTLVTFLATALLVTRLASRARQEARNADARRKDLAKLYELASRLVSVSPEVAVNRKYLGLFREVFGLQAVCLFDAFAAASSCDGESRARLEDLVRRCYIEGRDYHDQEARVTIHSLRAAGTPVGAVGFEGLTEADPVAGPLSALAAAMIQRARSFETASEAAAATQIEVLRSAILDAFAHQFKTPLAAISTAAGSLRETGPLVEQQEEMVETIEAQAAGLGRLTTRLLRMARLDREEIKPRLQTADLVAVVRRLADQYRNPPDDRRLRLDVAAGPVEVPSDPEMLGLAIVQLLDNAFRYSPPGSTITVAVACEADSAIVRVSNEGSPIPPEEQNRIFDRFYRGSAGLPVSGTGLGLYVARKIVLAHGGVLDLDKDQLFGGDTTFYLKLPLVTERCEHECTAS